MDVHACVAMMAPSGLGVLSLSMNAANTWEGDASNVFGMIPGRTTPSQKAKKMMMRT